MEIHKKLSGLVNQGKVRLIIPEVVIKEWDRLKQSKIVESKKSSIQGMIKNAKTISTYLNSDKSTVFKGILEDFEKQEDEIIRLASEEIQAIESLFGHPSTIKLSIKDEIKLQAVEFALAKKAPFGEKNSMADALILLRAIEYINSEQLTNCIFISENTKDFCSKTKKNQIHEDLSTLFDKCGMKYFSNIASAIDEVEKDLVSPEEINEIEREIQVESAQKVFENYSQAFREMFEAQRHLEELMGPTLEKMCETQRRLEKLMGPTLEKMRETQRRLEELMKPPVNDVIDESQNISEQESNHDEEGTDKNNE